MSPYHPTRRDLLKQTAAAAFGFGMLGSMHPRRLLASMSPEDQAQPPTLVVIYLRGGYDPLSTLVPFGDPAYYDMRPTIAIGPPTSRDVSENEAANRVLALNRYWGFHPDARGIYDLYQSGLLMPVVSCGSTHPTRSHFDAQDFMERAAPGVRSVTDGWLNRYLSITAGSSDTDLRAVSLQPTLPRSLRGEYPVLAAPTSGAERAMDTFEDLYHPPGCEDCQRTAERDVPNPRDSVDFSGGAMTQEELDARNAARAAEQAAAEPEDDHEHDHPVPDYEVPGDENHERILRAGSTGIERLRYLNQVLRAAPATRRDADYPDHHLAHRLRDTAKLIKANVGLEITAMDYGGWDTHVYQGNAENGSFKNMIKAVSDSLAAFTRDMGDRMAKTCVVVMSEFGRTVAENGNNGSDHGHGGMMMVSGGMVKPSTAPSGVYGEWNGLARRELYEGRDLPVHTDFRDVFAEILRKVFHFDADAHDFFPGYNADERASNMLNSLYEDVSDGPAQPRRRFGN